jgi:hypothetical protein
MYASDRRMPSRGGKLCYFELSRVELVESLERCDVLEKSGGLNRPLHGRGPHLEVGHVLSLHECLEGHRVSKRRLQWASATRMP